MKAFAAITALAAAVYAGPTPTNPLEARASSSSLTPITVKGNGKI